MAGTERRCGATFQPCRSQALKRGLKEKTTRGGFSPGAEHTVTCWAALRGSDHPQKHSGVPTSMPGTYLGQVGTSQFLTDLP